MLIFSIFVPAQSEKKLEKISIGELVTKHIAAIGSVDDIAAIKSRVIVGEGTLTSKIGSAFTLNGTAQLASKGDNILYAMIFNNTIYPYEKVAFNGTDQFLGLPNGKRTLLVDFFKSQGSILKSGLFTGALSTAWTLLDNKYQKSGKLEYAGTAKIDEKQCYKAKYSSSKTGDLKINLYFDAETFQHIRTDYEYTIEPQIGTSPTDVRTTSRVERYLLREDFSDFKTAGKLTLPFTYTVTVTNEKQIGSQTNSREWTIKVTQIYYDEDLGADIFKVS